MINLDSPMPMLEMPMPSLSAAPAPGAKGSLPDDARLQQVAKDFESVLLHKVMEEMGKTVPESGLLEDSGNDQVQSMFWFNLAQDVSNRGGLGLWQQLYKQMQSSVHAPATTSEQV